MARVGEGEAAQGGVHLLHVQLDVLEAGLAPSAQEGEGGHAPGEGPRQARVRGVEIGLHAREGILEEPLQEHPGPFPGQELQVGDPDAFGLRRGRGPRAEPVVAEPLLPLEEDDPLHRHRGAQAEHEGLQVGELLGPAADGRARGLHQIGGLLPEAGMDGMVLGLVGQGDQAIVAPGRGAQDPRHQDPPPLHADHLGRQEPRHPRPAHGLPHRGDQVLPPGQVLLAPHPQEGDALELLGEPGQLVVVAKVAEPRVHGLALGEAPEEVLPDAVQDLGLGQRLPELEQVAGALAVPAHHPPRAPLAALGDRELLDGLEPAPPQPPAPVHQDLPVAGRDGSEPGAWDMGEFYQITGRTQADGITGKVSISGR